MIRINAPGKRYSMLAVILFFSGIAGYPGFGNDGSETYPFVGKYWQLVSLTANPAVDWDLDGKTETNIGALTDPCEKDDAIWFSADGTVLRHHGTLKCDEDEDTEYQTGTWKYDEATNKLTFYEDDNAPQVYIVAETGVGKLVLLLDFKVKDKQHRMTSIYKVR